MIAEAHTYVETGHKKGNMVITLEQSMSNERSPTDWFKSTNGLPNQDQGPSESPVDRLV